MVSLYNVAIGVYIRQLANLKHILQKGEAFAKDNSVNPQTYTEARLIADMAPLTFQVQRVSDAAKMCAVRVGDVESVSMADDETTFEALYARIDKTVDFLKAVDPETFEGKDTAVIKFKVGGRDVELTGESYVLNYATPNILFHVTTAYDILRAQGVPVGKLDYLMGGAGGLSDAPSVSA